MPRQVDHDARRSEIARAVCELIAERGIEAATLRETADRAGVSMGAVQRAFSKDGMLRCALDHLSAQIKQRATARIETSPEPKSARTLLTVTLQELVFADPDQRVAARVWLAFVSHAATRAEFAEVIRTALADTLDLIVWLLEFGRSTGEIRDDVVIAPTARRLQLLVDGLTQHVVLGHTTAAAAHAEVDAAVRELTGM
ncbi:TetR/AcrR family transcriptional regulator [Nocardia sp. 2]|uniref:TetR/AcrR family transcriptional regulator n=1 Tax=Nocardia acididurans TaxID=2802282 RepID=A0ABS1MES8_9NOCA|nr:TetR/AcrR family transcriptional regulator [Nocardia acididurans]MBL1079160.1 TetR/AcrR family transcriptional regulator [Nocardia acididurans]